MDESVTVVASEWCVLHRPNSGGTDAHLNSARVREEFRLRGAFEFLVHGARGEFTQVPPEARSQHFPSTPGWWPQVEVPCGLPARTPQVVAYFGSHLRGSTKGHRVYAFVAKHWLVEVTRAWYSDVVHRACLWHLSSTLVGGISTLGSEWLLQEVDLGASRLLKAMKTLQNRLDLCEVEPYLRRAKRAAPRVAADPPQDFLHCTKGVARGCLRVLKGLGSSEPPYADGVTSTTPAPASSRDDPSHPGSARRESRRVVPWNRGRASVPAVTGGTLPVGSAARVCLPLPFEFIEPLPESVVGGMRGRSPVPLHLARELGSLLPRLGASLYDASMEAAFLTTIDTLGWVTRRVSEFLAQHADD